MWVYLVLVPLLNLKIFFLDKSMVYDDLRFPRLLIIMLHNNLYAPGHPLKVNLVDTIYDFSHPHFIPFCHIVLHFLPLKQSASNTVTMLYLPSNPPALYRSHHLIIDKNRRPDISPLPSFVLPFPTSS